LAAGAGERSIAAKRHRNAATRKKAAVVILVEGPPGHAVERDYALDFVLTGCLGQDWSYQFGDRDDLRLSIPGSDAALTLPDTLFSLSSSDWLSAASVPAGPLQQWCPDAVGLAVELILPGVPVIFGESGAAGNTGNLRLPLDIFGSVFFMLSRYEEVAHPVVGEFEWFPAAASLAHRANYIYRPIVDEYVEILWAAMRRLWPGLARRHRDGRMRISCDVDDPFDPTVHSPARLARTAVADLLKRRSPTLAAQRVRRFAANRRGDYRLDPYHTFDWYMRACDRAGHRAAFYFIPDTTDARMDGTYDIFAPEIIALLRQIAAHGHEIGTHGSYNSFRDAGQIAKEKARLSEACRRAGLNAEIVGNRQHYLRWDAAVTASHLDAAGYSYDTTGGYADVPGFRYGTARPFPMWDWTRNARCRLLQRPLILMEISVLSPAFLGLQDFDEALSLMVMLKQRATRFGGDFSLLWHNSRLMTPRDRRLFATLIGAQ
jgi:hypothetical protein